MRSTLSTKPVGEPISDCVLECAAVMLHGQKSKIGEVLCVGLTVEYLACNEGAEDLCAQDGQREQTTQVGRNAVVTCLQSFCFSHSREGLEKPFGSHEIVKENRL